MSNFNLLGNELTLPQTHRNLPPSALYEHAIRYEKEGETYEYEGCHGN